MKTKAKTKSVTVSEKQMSQMSFEELYRLLARVRVAHFGYGLVPVDKRMAIPDYLKVWKEIMRRRYPPGYECGENGVGHTGDN